MGTRIILMLVIMVAYNKSASANKQPPDITFVKNAVRKGAVCLNGTAPAYKFDPGHGAGANNWILHLEGGGWCRNLSECRYRWKYYNTTYFIPFEGIQSPNASLNPYFYNWNRIFVRYCDGGSFMADVDQVDPKTQIYYRGGRIFIALVEDLLERGMKHATNVILSGNSAGGLAAMLHCDQFRGMVSQVPRVKCVADSGFFIHGKNGLPGLDIRERDVFSIVDQHQLVNQLPKSCTSKMDDPRLCFFPEYFIRDIKTPLFLVNSEFDTFQIYNRTRHAMPYPDFYENCYKKEENCTPAEHKIIQDFKLRFLEALPLNDGSKTRGVFIDARQIHDHILGGAWHFRPKFELNNKTIAEAVGEWFYDKNCFRAISAENFPIRKSHK